MSARVALRDEVLDFTIDYILFLLALLQTGNSIGYLVRGSRLVFTSVITFW